MRAEPKQHKAKAERDPFGGEIAKRAARAAMGRALEGRLPHRRLRVPMPGTMRMVVYPGLRRRRAAEAEIERQAERPPVQHGQRPHGVHHAHRLAAPEQENVGQDEQAEAIESKI